MDCLAGTTCVSRWHPNLADDCAEPRSRCRDFNALVSAMPELHRQPFIGAPRGKVHVQLGMGQQRFYECMVSRHEHFHM
jgi:hypothetical protein